MVVDGYQPPQDDVRAGSAEYQLQIPGLRRKCVSTWGTDRWGKEELRTCGVSVKVSSRQGELTKSRADVVRRGVSSVKVAR